MDRRAWLSLLFAGSLALTAVASFAGCGSETEVDPGGDDGGGGGEESSVGSSGFVNPDSGKGGKDSGPSGPNNCVAPTALTIAPANLSKTVTVGTPFTQAFTVKASYAGKPDQDVTAASFFTISDPGAGSFTGPVFTWGGKQGGFLTVSVQQCGVVGTTALNLKLATVIGVDVDAGVGSGAAAQFNGALPSTVPACNPNLVYPPDGALLPPNTNVIEVHFTGGSPANTTYELSFENSVTDVKVYTTCSGATPAVGTQIGGGCVFELDQKEWDFISKTNRDGDPVVVTIRGIGCDGAKVSSSNTRKISFAKEDVVGTLYYWASMRITVGGKDYNSGGVYRYDFGVRGQTAEPVLTPNSAVNTAENNCIGCHSISRDGRQMVFDFDDNDSDDEYGDVFTDVYDIAAKTVVRPVIKNGANSFPPGFHTWNRSTTEFLLSDGPGSEATPPGSFRRVSPEGGTNGYTTPGTVRGTTPDWAPDDARVVFAVPPNIKANAATAGYWMAKEGPRDDLMFAGADLQIAPWNAATKSLGAPTTLLASDGSKNFYYPSFSPDGSLIIYNFAPSGANFHNPLARVEVINAAAATPTRDDLAKLNDVGNLTNSWARWSPFVQNYKGKKLLWVTMSSTRNYGLRIDNGGTVNCYPKESPNWVVPDFTSPPAGGCSRTQLWMAAIDLDPAAVQAGTDVSHPAFFLPFQDMTTNNHLGQWAQKSFTGTCTTNAQCTAQPGKCCDNGGCTSCPTPPSPPPAQCSANANCATNQCCNAGVCGACSGGSNDGGMGPVGCNTCLDCSGQACVNSACGSCTSSAQCCAPLSCVMGQCVNE